jgi:hypothetical protein
MDAQRLAQLHIDADAKQRPQKTLALIFIVIGLITATTVFFAWPRASDQFRKIGASSAAVSGATTSPTGSSPVTSAPGVINTNSAPAKTDDRVALTVSG